VALTCDYAVQMRATLCAQLHAEHLLTEHTLDAKPQTLRDSTCDMDGPDNSICVGGFRHTLPWGQDWKRSRQTQLS